jgi:hypothetical protein
MNATEIKRAVKLLWSAGNVPIVIGGPGLGKSQVITQATAEYVREHADAVPAYRRILESGASAEEMTRVIMLASRNPVSITGLPAIDHENKSTYFTRPDIIPSDTDKMVCAFFDEITHAPQMVQGAAYQIILDREVNNFKYAPHILIAAASNRKEDKGVYNEMPKPLANRFVFLNLEYDNDTWLDWAAVNGIRDEIRAYARWRPNLMYAFPGSEVDISGSRIKTDASDTCFPTPRMWAMLSRTLAAGIPAEIESEMIAGHIGQAVGADFAGFLRVWRQMPDPALALLSPDTCPVPAGPGARYAVSAALASRVTEATLGNAVRYFKRFTDSATGAIQSEYGVVFMLDATRIKPELQGTSEFITWMTDNGDVLGIRSGS